MDKLMNILSAVRNPEVTKIAEQVYEQGRADEKVKALKVMDEMKNCKKCNGYCDSCSVAETIKAYREGK
jgi:hypothetical protein